MSEATLQLKILFHPRGWLRFIVSVFGVRLLNIFGSVCVLSLNHLDFITVGAITSYPRTMYLFSKPSEVPLGFIGAVVRYTLDSLPTHCAEKVFFPTSVHLLDHLCDSCTVKMHHKKLNWIIYLVTFTCFTMVECITIEFLKISI